MLVNIAACAEGRDAIFSLKEADVRTSNSKTQTQRNGNNNGSAVQHVPSVQEKSVAVTLVSLVTCASRATLGLNFKELVLSLVNNLSFDQRGAVELLDCGVITGLTTLLNAESNPKIREYSIYVIHALLKHVPLSRFDAKKVTIYIFFLILIFPFPTLLMLL